MNAGAQSAHALIENNGLGNPTFRVSGGLPPIRKSKTGINVRVGDNTTGTG